MKFEPISKVGVMCASQGIFSKGRIRSVYGKVDASRTSKKFLKKEINIPN